MIIGIAASKLPASSIAAATRAADTTVIGPVGPLACVAVPPKIAANIPNAIAPYKPAIAPKPDCTPKAHANGKATTPATSPPVKSPFKYLKS